MFDKYKSGQPVAIKFMESICEKKNYSHAYLFEKNGNSDVLNIAKDFAKKIICNSNDCFNCNQCKRIDEGNFLDLKIISPDGLMIKKTQMDELQKEFSTKPIEASKKIYIINDADKLNTSASNSILKFLEEPEDDIIAILLVDNRYNLLSTIVSRCQLISFINNKEKDGQADKYNRIAMISFSDDEEIKNFLGNNSKLQIIDSAVEFAKYSVNKVDDLFYFIPSSYNEVVKDKKDAIIYFESLILIYKDAINLILNRDLYVFKEDIDLIESLSKKYSLEKLCIIIDNLLKLKDDISFNLNLNLLLDKLIITFKEV